MAGDRRYEQSELFARRLLALLEERDMKPADLARELHVDRATISRYLKGRIPPVASLTAIADFFGVTVDYLLGRTDDRRGVARTTPDQGGAGDDELYVVFRGKPQELSPEYKRVLIDMMEAANRKMAESKKGNKEWPAT